MIKDNKTEVQGHLKSHTDAHGGGLEGLELVAHKFLHDTHRRSLHMELAGMERPQGDPQDAFDDHAQMQVETRPRRAETQPGRP